MGRPSWWDDETGLTVAVMLFHCSQSARQHRMPACSLVWRYNAVVLFNENEQRHHRGGSWLQRYMVQSLCKQKGYFLFPTQVNTKARSVKRGGSRSVPDRLCFEADDLVLCSEGQGAPESRAVSRSCTQFQLFLFFFTLL